MSEKTPTVRKNIRDLSNPLELRELNRQMEWVWRKILGGLDERAFSDGGIRKVTTTVEKIVATEMTADTIDTNFLNAAIAKMMVAVIGVCDVDYLTAVDANVENLIVRRGLGNSFTFDNLKIVYAQIVSATIGELCVKASDGNYYTLDVDAEGKVTASMATVTDGEIAVGHTNAGKVILGTDIVAEELSTSDLFATFALVDKIDASRINVDTLVARAAFAEKLFATEAFVNALYTSKIYGGKSLEMIAGEVAQNAQDIANIDALDVYTGDEPPELPMDVGKIWIDTGVRPTVIRRWLGTVTSTDRDDGGWDTVSDLEEINEISSKLQAQQAEAQKAIDRLATAITIDTSGAHFYKPGYRDRSEVRIDQDSVDILVGGSVNSSFIAGGLILGNYMLWHPEAAGGLAFNLM